MGLFFILFHPDYHRRLWSLTRSADPAVCTTGARGLLPEIRTITAGGEFHPALRISQFFSDTAMLSVDKAVSKFL